MSPASTRVVVALGLLLGLAGGPACDQRDDQVVILVAASLADVAADLVDAWGGDAVTSEGGSQVLATQVRAGAPADLLLSADPSIAGSLADDGFAGPPTPVARNGLAVVARAGSDVDAVTDLAATGLRVVLADEAVPLGGYTRQALAALERDGTAPDGFARQVLTGADSLEDDARTVLAKVSSGEADAAIVYRTDATAAERAGADVRTIAWPPEADVTATYTAQVLHDAGNPGPAQTFVTFLRSRDATEIWRSHGFVPINDP